jgi:hypothetical protein
MPGVESRHGQTAKRHRPDICPDYGDLQMIDATSVRVHQHAACAQKN